MFAALSAGETPAVPVSQSTGTLEVISQGRTFFAALTAERSRYCAYSFSDFDEDSSSSSGSGHGTVPNVQGKGSLAGNEPSNAASIASSVTGLQSGCSDGDFGCSWFLSISLRRIRQLSRSFGERAAACDIFVFFNHARVAQWIRAFASGAKGRRFDPCRGYHNQ